MDFSTLLQDFGERYSLGKPEISADDTCTLQVSGNRYIQIELSEDKQTIFFSGALCQIPSSDEERLNLFDRLMIGHAFGFQTKNAYFGAVPLSNQVILFKQLSIAETEPESFSAQLRDFIEIHAAWSKEYDGGRLTESTATPVATVAEPEEGEETNVKDESNEQSPTSGIRI